MAGAGFLFQLESIWGWQIGSVSSPPLLSSEELFSIHYGYVNFFLSVLALLEQVRCNCGVLRTGSLGSTESAKMKAKA